MATLVTSLASPYPQPWQVVLVGFGVDNVPKALQYLCQQHDASLVAQCSLANLPTTLGSLPLPHVVLLNGDLPNSQAASLSYALRECPWAQQASLIGYHATHTPKAEHEAPWWFAKVDALLAEHHPPEAWLALWQHLCLGREAVADLKLASATPLGSPEPVAQRLGQALLTLDVLQAFKALQQPVAGGGGYDSFAARLFQLVAMVVPCHGMALYCMQPSQPTAWVDMVMADGATLTPEQQEAWFALLAPALGKASAHNEGNLKPRLFYEAQAALPDPTTPAPLPTPQQLWVSTCHNNQNEVLALLCCWLLPTANAPAQQWPASALLSSAQLQTEVQHCLGFYVLREQAQLAQRWDTTSNLPTLTGFIEALEREWARSARHELRLSVAKVSVANQQQVLATFGSAGLAAADALLTQQAKQYIRQADTLGHLAPLTLGLLMPETPDEEASIPLQRLTDRVGQVALLLNGQSLPLQLQWQVASYTPKRDKSASMLWQRVEKAPKHHA